MKKIILLSAIVFTFFSGCTEDVNLTVVGGEIKIVVEGKIESGKVAEVFVMRSNPLSSTRDYKDFYFVADAIITLSDGTTTETLNLATQFDEEAAYYLPYKGNTIIGTPGKTYTLTIVAKPDPDKTTKKTYTATTTIPALMSLDSVWWKPQAPYDTLGYVWAHLSEPAGMGHAYKWFAKRSNKWYAQGELRDRRYLAPSGSAFDDKFIDGKSFDLSYFRGLDPSDSLTQADPTELMNYYKKTDTIFIKFCTTDLITNKFYTTYEAAYQTNGNPFASPVSIQSNISDGGLGVWAGFGCTYDTILPQ